METQLAGLVRTNDKPHLLSQSVQLDRPQNGSASLRVRGAGLGTRGKLVGHDWHRVKCVDQTLLASTVLTTQVTSMVAHLQPNVAGCLLRLSFAHRC